MVSDLCKPNYEGNGFKRFINMISYFLMVLKYQKILDEKPDVVIGSSVYLFAALAGILISKKYKVLSIRESDFLYSKWRGN